MIILYNLIVICIYLIICKSLNVKINFIHIVIILIITNLLFYGLKKEKYNNLLIDYNPSYIEDVIINNQINIDSSGSGLNVPNYNSQLFCNKFSKYNMCSDYNNNDSPSIFLFTMALLGSYYDISILDMINVDYPNLKLNNSKYVGNITKSDITPFIPNISYTFNLENIVNNKIYQTASKNNLGNYESVLSLFGENMIENNIYDILNLINMCIIDYVGDKNNSSEYIDLKKSFINNSLDTRYGNTADYLEGGDPDLLCSNQSEYAANEGVIFAKNPIPSRLYYIKDLKSNLFLNSNIIWENNNNDSTINILSSDISYFYIKYNEDKTYNIINNDRQYLYYDIGTIPESITFTKYKPTTQNDNYKFYINYNSSSFHISTKIGDKILTIIEGKLRLYSSESEINRFLIGISNKALYRNLPHNINIPCNGKSSVGRWTTSSDNCQSACLGITKTEINDGIEVGKCSDSSLVLCSCCKFEDGYSARVYLTTWLNNKINLLKDKVLNIIINILTSSYNKYNENDPYQVRFLGIFSITMALIVNMYQEKTLVDHSNKNGTYYKPWENIKVIEEMRNFIFTYLPFLNLMIEKTYINIAKNMNIIFQITQVPTVDTFQTKYLSSGIKCTIKYSLMINNTEVFSPRTDEYDIDYYPVLGKKCTTVESVFVCVDYDEYISIKANAENNYNPDTTPRKKWHWFYDDFYETISSTNEDNIIYKSIIRLKNLDNLEKIESLLSDDMTDKFFLIDKKIYELYTSDIILREYYSNTKFLFGPNYIKGDKKPRDKVSGIYNNIFYFVDKLYKDLNTSVIKKSFENIGGIDINNELFYSSPVMSNGILVPAYDDTTRLIYPFGINSENWANYILYNNFKYNCSDIIKININDYGNTYCKNSEGITLDNYGNISQFLNVSNIDNLCCPIDSSGNISIQICHDPYSNFKGYNRIAYCVNDKTLSQNSGIFNEEIEGVEYILDEAGNVIGQKMVPINVPTQNPDIPNILSNTVNSYICNLSDIDYFNRYYPHINIDAYNIVDRGTYYIRLNHTNLYLYSNKYENYSDTNLYVSSIDTLTSNNFCVFTTFITEDNTYIIGCSNIKKSYEIDYSPTQSLYDYTDINYLGFLYFNKTTNSIIINKNIKYSEDALLITECLFNIELQIDGSYFLSHGITKSLYLYYDNNLIVNNNPSSFVFKYANFGTIPDKLMTVTKHYNQIGKYIGFIFKGDLCIDFTSSKQSKLNSFSNRKLLISTVSIENKIYLFSVGNDNSYKCNIYDSSTTEWQPDTITSSPNNIVGLSINCIKQNSSIIYVYSIVNNFQNIEIKYFSVENKNFNSNSIILNIGPGLIESNYIPMELFSINNSIYIALRKDSGLSILKYSIGGDNTTVSTSIEYSENISGLSYDNLYRPWNNNGYWNIYPNYYKIKYILVNNNIYCIGLTLKTIEVKVFDTTNNIWILTKIINSPDINQLQINDFYITLMIHTIGNSIYLLFKIASGLIIYKFDTITNNWSQGNVLYHLNDSMGIYISSGNCLENTLVCRKRSDTSSYSLIKSCVNGKIICVFSINIKEGKNNSPVYSYYHTELNTWINDYIDNSFSLNNIPYPNWNLLTHNILQYAGTFNINSVTGNKIIIYMQTPTDVLDFYVLTLNKTLELNIPKETSMQTPTPSNSITKYINPNLVYKNTFKKENIIIISKTGILSMLNFKIDIIPDIILGDYIYINIYSLRYNINKLSYSFKIPPKNIDEDIFTNVFINQGDILYIGCSFEIFINTEIKLWINNIDNTFTILNYDMNIEDKNTFLIEDNITFKNIIFNYGQTIDFNLNMTSLNNPNGSLFGRYITIPSFSIVNELSISLWMMLYSNNIDNTCVLSLKDNGTNYIDIYIYNNILNIRYNTQSISIITLIPYIKYNILFTVSTKGIWKFYLNGLLVDVKDNFGELNNISFIYNYIGKSNINENIFYNGNISNLKIYGRELEYEEIFNIHLDINLPSIYIPLNNILVFNNGIYPGYISIDYPNNILFNQILQMIHINNTLNDTKYISISNFELFNNGISFSIWFILTNSNSCIMNLNNYITIQIINYYVVLTVNTIRQISISRINTNALNNLIWNIRDDGLWELFINNNYTECVYYTYPELILRDRYIPHNKLNRMATYKDLENTQVGIVIPNDGWCSNKKAYKIPSGTIISGSEDNTKNGIIIYGIKPSNSDIPTGTNPPFNILPYNSTSWNSPGTIPGVTPELYYYTEGNGFTFKEAWRKINMPYFKIASYNNLLKSWESGAKWYTSGWVIEGRKYYPMNNDSSYDGSNVGIIEETGTGNSGILVYGIKPFKENLVEGITIKPFNSILWNTPGVIPGITPEVFFYNEINGFSYREACELINNVTDRIATLDQLRAAQTAGAEWCYPGWCSDKKIYYPMNSVSSSCGNQVGVIEKLQDSSIINKAGVVIYGIKPPRILLDDLKIKIYPFNNTRWNNPNVIPGVTPEVYCCKEEDGYTWEQAWIRVYMQDFTLATKEQLKNSLINGMKICSSGWISNNKLSIYTPNPDCVESSNFAKNDGIYTGGVFLYGVKPLEDVVPESGFQINNFNNTTNYWNKPGVVSGITPEVYYFNLKYSSKGYDLRMLSNLLNSTLSYKKYLKMVIKYYPNNLTFTNNYLGKYNSIYFNGYMSEFRIYNKSLNLYEISTLYNTTFPYLFLPFSSDENNYGSGNSVSTLEGSAKVSKIENTDPSYCEIDPYGDMTCNIPANTNIYLSLNKTTNDYCKIDKINTNNTGLSFLCWINNKSDSGTIFSFKNSENSLGLISSIEMSILNSQLNFSVEGAGFTYTQYNIQLNVFTHIAWTINPDGFYTIYINGELKLIKEGTYPLIIERDDNKIGPMSGNIGDFRMYNRVLTQEEIVTIGISTARVEPTPTPIPTGVSTTMVPTQNPLINNPTNEQIINYITTYVTNYTQQGTYYYFHIDSNLDYITSNNNDTINIITRNNSYSSTYIYYMATAYFGYIDLDLRIFNKIQPFTESNLKVLKIDRLILNLTLGASGSNLGRYTINSISHT
jgi:hypothetical protein